MTSDQLEMKDILEIRAEILNVDYSEMETNTASQEFLIFLKTLISNET